MVLRISCDFDSGNIECVRAETVKDIQLKIRPDNQSHFFQWFHFRLSGAKGEGCKLRIVNAQEAAFINGWFDYHVVASYDRKHWFRVPTTSYTDGELMIDITPQHDSVYLAYFAPYSMERHADLVARMQIQERVKLLVLGQSLDGQDIDCLRIGEPSSQKKSYWVIARQHPGETMAEWWVEGFLNSLLDANHAIARNLLDHVVFYVVPNMNPDGSRRGHLRTNAAGVNLNREWDTPTMERSPEVALVLSKMIETGLDFCLDVHGDEGLPYNFLVSAGGIPNWGSEDQACFDAYKNALVAASPDFQTQYGYPSVAPGKADLRICTNALAQRFGRLCMTLEMPFKDTANQPCPTEGWSPERCRQLADANLRAMWNTLSVL